MLDFECDVLGGFNLTILIQLLGGFNLTILRSILIFIRVRLEFFLYVVGLMCRIVIWYNHFHLGILYIQGL